MFPVAMIITISIAIAITLLCVASYFDLKTGEIPDEISLGLLGLSIFFSLLFSLLNWNFNIVLWSVAYGIFFFLFGYLSFYFGELGGGDVKLLAGIGSALGFLERLNLFNTMLPVAIDFLINLGLVTIPYSICYALFLTIRKPMVIERFFDEIKRLENLFMIFLSGVISIFLAAIGFPIFLFFFPFLVILTIFFKTLETHVLEKEVSIEQLREGDLLAEDVIIDNKTIIAMKDARLGLEIEQIEMLKKLKQEGKLEKIKIKEGMKFAPALGLAFILTVYFDETLITYLLKIIFPSISL